MIEYKYYLNAMPGAVPKDFVRIDENDKDIKCNKGNTTLFMR